VLARPINDPAEIVKSLVAQVTGTVRWRESVAFMASAGVDSFYEIGAGKVLSGLVKRIAEGATEWRSNSEDVAPLSSTRQIALPGIVRDSVSFSLRDDPGYSPAERSGRMPRNAMI